MLACDALLAVDVCIISGCWTEVRKCSVTVCDIWDSFLYIHTHTHTHRRIRPPLPLTSVTMVMWLRMMALRLVRASVKTAVVLLASKYSFCYLDACSQHFFFLSQTEIPWWPEVKLLSVFVFFFFFSFFINILAISKFTHATAGMKALLMATWDLPLRNSTTVESASEYSLPASDLFMRANKAIRWGNLPSGKFMCVFVCTTECLEVLWLYPFPASW